MIKIKVTQERFDAILDLADACNLGDVKVSEAFEYLLQFTVDENGEYVDVETARKMFKEEHVKRGEIGKYWLEFVKKTNEAFVPPPSGAA